MGFSVTFFLIYQINFGLYHQTSQKVDSIRKKISQDLNKVLEFGGSFGVETNCLTLDP